MNSIETSNAAHVHRIVTTLPESDQREDWIMMAACNDPDNGRNTGKADQFSFSDGDHELQIEGPTVVFGWHYRGDQHRMRVGRYGFPCNGYWQWYGNWCWDATKVTDETLAVVCFRLKQKGYEPHQASEAMWKWFQSL